jgi:hypothetical protein
MEDHEKLQALLTHLDPPPKNEQTPFERKTNRVILLVLLVGVIVIYNSWPVLKLYGLVH